jgi:hypothetical protein
VFGNKYLWKDGPAPAAVNPLIVRTYDDGPFYLKSSVKLWIITKRKVSTKNWVKYRSLLVWKPTPTKGEGEETLRLTLRREGD